MPLTFHDTIRSVGKANNGGSCLLLLLLLMLVYAGEAVC